MTTFQKKRDFANIFTKVVTNTIYTTEENCGEVFMKNTGATNALFRGNVTNSEWVSLGAGEAYAFGYIGLPRQPFEIDATGTIVEVSMSL
jgi:hypothetical protein